MQVCDSPVRAFKGFQVQFSHDYDANLFALPQYEGLAFRITDFNRARFSLPQDFPR